MGVWYVLKNNKQSWERKIIQITNNILDTIHYSKMTDKEKICTINAILFPGIEYLSGFLKLLLKTLKVKLDRQFGDN